MMKCVIVAVVLLTGLSMIGCGETGRDDRQDPELVLTGKTAKFLWAILPPEAGNDIYDDWGPFFQANADDVQAALQGIRAHLQTQLKVEFDPKVASTKIWRRMVTEVIGALPHYKCQVVGVVGEDERRYLFLNFVHEDGFLTEEEGGSTYVRDWTIEPEVVDDGGHWFWQVCYYLDSGEYERTRINGQA